MHRYAVNLRHVKFILPTAPRRKVTMGGGEEMPSWFDILGGPDRLQEPCEGLEASGRRIRELVLREMEAGTPSHRVLVGGFSQGGATALFAGLGAGFPFPLAGLLACSAYLPMGAAGFGLSPHSRFTPVLQVHGAEDDVVRPAWAEASRDAMLRHGVQVDC